MSFVDFSGFPWKRPCLQQPGSPAEGGWAGHCRCPFPSEPELPLPLSLRRRLCIYLLRQGAVPSGGAVGSTEPALLLRASLPLCRCQEMPCSVPAVPAPANAARASGERNHPRHKHRLALALISADSFPAGSGSGTGRRRELGRCFLPLAEGPCPAQRQRDLSPHACIRRGKEPRHSKAPTAQPKTEHAMQPIGLAGTQMYRQQAVAFPPAPAVQSSHTTKPNPSTGRGPGSSGVPMPPGSGLLDPGEGLCIDLSRSVTIFEVRKSLCRCSHTELNEASTLCPER